MEDLNCLLGAEGQQQLSGWATGEDTAHRLCRERNRVHDTGRLGPFLTGLCTMYRLVCHDPKSISPLGSEELAKSSREGETEEERRGKGG